MNYEYYYEQINTWFWTQVQTNDFANGALFAGAATFLFYQLKSLPMRIWHFFVYLFVFSIEVESTETSFFRLMDWVAPKLKTPVRSLEIRSSEYGDVKTNDGMINNQKIAFGYFNGIPFKSSVNERELEMPGNGTIGAKIFTLRLTFPVFFKKRVLKEIKQLSLDKLDDGKVEVWTGVSFGDPCGYRKIYPRKIESVILDAGLKESVLEECEHFLSGKEKYHNIGIPWRRGYMFTGSPGQGKSSFITALAGKFKLGIYYYSLGGADKDDKDLIDMFSYCNEKSLVVLEDFDRIFNENKEVTGQKFTTSGLLNAIDGICSCEGRILIITCNDIERIPDAIKRPGRIDRIIEFTQPNEDKIERLSKLINPDISEEELKQVKLMNFTSMAQVQEYLINNFCLR